MRNSESTFTTDQYAQWQLTQKHPLAWQILGTSSRKEMSRLEQDERDLQQEKVRVENEITRLRGVLAGLDKLPQPPEFQVNRQLSAPFLNKFCEALEINDQLLAGLILSYYSGERELFNDTWTGEGYCVYSETADRTGHSKLFGRGLKGIGDTILKIFGI